MTSGSRLQSQPSCDSIEHVQNAFRYVESSSQTSRRFSNFGFVFFCPLVNKITQYCKSVVIRKEEIKITYKALLMQTVHLVLFKVVPVTISSRLRHPQSRSIKTMFCHTVIFTELQENTMVYSTYTKIPKYSLQAHDQ